MTKRKDVITVLEELIKIDSRNPFYAEKPDPDDASTWKTAGSETEIAGYTENMLKESGFRVEKQYVHTGPDGAKFYNILGEKGAGDKSVLFYGHMDTVTSNPWLSEEAALTPVRKMRLVGGKEIETITGLGANDMKAGLAAMLAAFREIEPETHKIKAAFGVDEEFYSLGAGVLAASGFMDDVAGIIIPESVEGPSPCCGPRAIILGRLGRCEYVIDVPGTGGHGAHSYNEKFVNAATECSKIVGRLEEMRASHKDEFVFAGGDAQDESCIIKGSFFVNRMEAGDGSLSVPSAGIISVDWTFTPNFTIEDGLKKLQDLVDEMYARGELREVSVSGEIRKVKVRMKPRPTPASNAYITPHDHPFTEFAAKAVDDCIGFAGFGMGCSVADENVFRRIRPEIPVLVIGPLGGDCHLADEWVGIESVRKLEDVFSEIARSFGKTRKQG